MSDGHVTVYDCVTGAALRRWPVDAREMVASGDYTWSPVAPTPATPEPADVVPGDAPAPSNPRRRR